MMNALRSPESPLPSHIEFAGALQAILRSNQSRIYDLDIQQEASVQGIGAAIAGGELSGYVEMATGTGKTTVEALLTEAAVNAGQRVLLLAPSITGAEQISGLSSDKPKGLAKFTDLHDRKAVRHHFGTRRANSKSAVVVSTYSGFLYDFKEDHAKLGQFDVVIADECHRSLGEKTAEAIKAAYPGAIKIGLSATPDYATDRTSEEVFDKRLYHFSLAEAIETGKTAPVRALLIETDTTLVLTENQPDFTDKEQAPLARDVQRNALITNLARDFVKDGRQGIVACIAGGGNLHARLIADMLTRPEFGSLRAADIGGHLDPTEVKKRLAQFERGEIDILTSTRAILESWDSSRASFCINTAPTTSPVKVKQLMGRILRRKMDGREGIFVDLVDSQRGVRKQQYTALHALDIKDVDYNRVIGRTAHDPSKKHEMKIADLPTFNQDIFQRLGRTQGKTLLDVFKPNLSVVDDQPLWNTDDPLFKHWEKILAGEGMPAELDPNLVVPERFMKIYRKALDNYLNKSQTVPSHTEVVQAISHRITNEALRALGVYGLRYYIDDEPLPLLSDDSNETAYMQGLILATDSIAEIDNTTTDEPFDSAGSSLLSEQLKEVFKTLSEREAGTISMRFGLDGSWTYEMGELTDQEAFVINCQLQSKLKDITEDSDEEVGYVTGDDRLYSLDEIGKRYGVTRERIRQVESKAMSKIRHPSRSSVLRPYLFEDEATAETTRQLRERISNQTMLDQLATVRREGRIDELLGDNSPSFQDLHSLKDDDGTTRSNARLANQEILQLYENLFAISPDHSAIQKRLDFYKRQAVLKQKVTQLEAVYDRRPRHSKQPPEVYESIRKDMVMYLQAIMKLDMVRNYTDRYGFHEKFDGHSAWDE